MIFIIEFLKKESVGKLLALDARVYGTEHQVTKETTIRRLEVNPETDILVRKKDCLVGYITLCPVEEAVFNQIIKGTATEEEIESSVVPFNRIGYYQAYLSSIVVDKQTFPDFKGMLLFGYLQEHIKRLKRKGIMIDRIVAVAVTAAGKAVLKKLKFKEIRRNIFIRSCLKEGAEFIRQKIMHPSRKELSFTCLMQEMVEKLYHFLHSLELCVWDWDSDT